MYVLSQIFVVMSGILFATTYLTRKKTILLILNIFNNILFGTHYLLLKSYTAGYSVLLTILFLIAIYFLERYEKEKFTFIVSIACSLILIPITILTWSSPLSLVPAIAILLVFVGSLFKNLLIVKLFYFTSTSINTVFLFLVKSYFGFAVNLIILTVAIIGIISQIKLNKKV